MTEVEWERLWWDEFRRLRHEFPTGDMLKLHKATTTYMIKRYGAKPEEQPGPPWWMDIGALAIGVQMGTLGKLWDFLNGKKTIVGAFITVVAYLVAGIPLAAALCTTTVCATTVAKVAGVGLTVVGVLHKIYKFLYKEEHQ